MNREHPDEELRQLLDERWGDPPAERKTRKESKNTSTHHKGQK